MITFIPYVNRLDLLFRAVESIAGGGEIVIINNSGEEIPKSYLSQIETITPIIPLTFSQTMNLCIKEALRRGVPYYCMMHNDAQCDDGMQKIKEVAESLDLAKTKWGMIITNYDAFCCFNMKAVKEIGWWDINLPQYFSDYDYYYRMYLAGYVKHESAIICLHEPSQTIKAETTRTLVSDQTHPLYRQYIINKWGGTGEWGTLQNKVPFNDDRLKDMNQIKIIIQQQTKK